MTIQDDRLTNEYRLSAVHAGLILSWLTLATLTLWALTTSTDDRVRLLLAFGGFAVALVLLSVVPWRRTLRSPIVDWLITLWCAGALLGQLCVDLHLGHTPAAAGFVMVPFFASATASSIRPTLFVGAASVVSYTIALGESTGYLTATSVVTLVVFVAAMALVTMISVRIRGQIHDSSVQIEELVAREAELVGKEQDLAQMKTDFVSVVSHELRTPLTSIMGALGTLKHPELLPEDPRVQQLINMADKQSHRLKILIEDLLVMSRVEAAGLPVRLATIEIDPFVRELLEAVSNAEQVTLEVDPATRHIVTDPDLFTRIVTNLVENAIKYGEGSDIEIRTGAHGEDVHISVIDHGPGIPLEQHDLVFERFTQLQPHATRSAAGVGLGLSIVKALTEAMGGRVWFDPTPGGGTTFTVALPADGVVPDGSTNNS